MDVHITSTQKGVDSYFHVLDWDKYESLDHEIVLQFISGNELANYMYCLQECEYSCSHI